MRKLQRRAGLVITGLLVVSALLIPASSAQAKSTSYQPCGQVHWIGKKFLNVAGSQLPCSEALSVAHALVSAIYHAECELATFCEVKGFKCPITSPRGSAVRCHKDAARVRLTAAKD